MLLVDTKHIRFRNKVVSCRILWKIKHDVNCISETLVCDSLYGSKSSLHYVYWSSCSIFYSLIGSKALLKFNKTNIQKDERERERWNEQPKVGRVTDGWERERERERSQGWDAEGLKDQRMMTEGLRERVQRLRQDSWISRADERMTEKSRERGDWVMRFEGPMMMRCQQGLDQLLWIRWMGRRLQTSSAGLTS